MRAVFQTQPEVAHVYLGSKRSMMEGLFNDANEPFWRSAKQIELGVIAPEDFAPFIRERFEGTGGGSTGRGRGVLAITRGHPYATQELCYALWEETPGAPSRPDEGAATPRSSACCAARTRTSRSSGSRRHGCSERCCRRRRRAARLRDGGLPAAPRATGRLERAARARRADRGRVSSAKRGRVPDRRAVPGGVDRALLRIDARFDLGRVGERRILGAAERVGEQRLHLGCRVPRPPRR